MATLRVDWVGAPLRQVRVGADTQAHDLDMKLRTAQGFIERNMRVKLVVRFKRWRAADGAQRLRDLADRVGAWASVTAPQANEKLTRNTVAVYLAPKLGAAAPTQEGKPGPDDGPAQHKASSQDSSSPVRPRGLGSGRPPAPQLPDMHADPG